MRQQAPVFFLLFNTCFLFGLLQPTMGTPRRCSRCWNSCSDRDYWLMRLEITHDYLVGGLVAIFYFPIYWVYNHPNWRTHIFQRGGPGPPTRCFCIDLWLETAISMFFFFFLYSRHGVIQLTSRDRPFGLCFNNGCQVWGTSREGFSNYTDQAMPLQLYG